MALTVGSMFTGIGGIDLGLERAGMRVVWQAETDRECSRVLAKHWPDVPNLGDVRNIEWERVERPDVLAGGPPCQPYSRAGKRLGQADVRDLWPQMAEAVRVLRPRFVVVENVPGFRANGMARTLGYLAACGYDAQWDCVPAASVGAPHRRDRLWIVAHAPDATRGRFPGRFGTGGEWPESAWHWPEPNGRAGSGRAWETAFPRRRYVAYGVPGRVAKLKALGNAVVPQVAEHVGRIVVAMSAGEP